MRRFCRPTNLFTTEYIKHSLDSTIKDIDKKTSQMMDEKKQQATEVKTYVSADKLYVCKAGEVEFALHEL